MDDVAAAFDPQLMFDFPDPYPMFAEMRRAQPVAHFTMLGRENYVVTRYDDVWAVLRDGDTYSSRANYEVGKFFGRTIIEMDGKEHARTRALVSAVFSARAIEALQPVITRLVHERIDTFAGAVRADLVAELTTIFPVQVIAHIVGVPAGDYARFMRWSLDLIAFSKDPAKGRAASDHLHDYLLPQVRSRRAEPHDDVITKLVTGTVDGVGLTDDEVISFLRLLLPAGAETTAPTTTCRSASGATSASGITWRRWRRARRSVPSSIDCRACGWTRTRSRRGSRGSRSARRKRCGCGGSTEGVTADPSLHPGDRPVRARGPDPTRVPEEDW